MLALRAGKLAAKRAGVRTVASRLASVRRTTAAAAAADGDDELPPSLRGPLPSEALPGLPKQPRGETLPRPETFMTTLANGVRVISTDTHEAVRRARGRVRVANRAPLGTVLR